MKIPLMNLKDGLTPIREEVHKKIDELIDNTRFVGGSEIPDFEANFARYCGVEYAIGCSNGTDAIVLALRALGIGSGDTVIVPVNSFIASSEAVSEAGAKVRFIDVDKKTSLLDADELDRCLRAWNDSSIKAVIAVHLYGQMVNMDSLGKVAKKYDIKIIEDSAQAHGALYKGHGPGYWGDVAAFSFYPGKNLGAFGDGGAVVTRNEEIAKKVRLFVNHGREPGEKYIHSHEGGNKRLDTLQAAILDIKLRYLPDATEERKIKASYYLKKLDGVKGVVLPSLIDGGTPVWHLFVIHVENRDDILAKLKEQGISASIHYPIPLHLQPAYSYMNFKEGDFPAAEELAKKAISLPLWPEISNDQQDYVVNTLCKLLKD